MAKIIMIQGTMSNAGKSLITAGLCRVFAQDGYRVAPFKSQNMALNSYVTASGLEMGRAQVMQAEAAGIEPCAEMNPILLKPTSDTGSQVVVMGKARCNMGAADYYKYKTQLIPDIKEAFAKLEEKADIIVIEGAGSPAEVNLKQNDIVNMGLAKMLGAPVLLAGDIDRGGVFAQLLGTLLLLDDEEKNMVKGLIINKFRGDKSLLDPGIKILEEKGGIPVAGVLPYTRVQVDDEDSLSERLETKSAEAGGVQIAVVRLPHISNFTDFNIFEEIPNVHVKYISTYVELQDADMVILPGSKNTIADLRWLQERGLAAAINRYASSHPVFGICGGFQMLGKAVHDPYHTEEGGSFPGLDLLPVETVMQEEKTTVQCEGVLGKIDGIFKDLSGKMYRGYEIHTGQTGDGADGVSDGACGLGDARHDPVIVHGNVYGSYIHGLFDHKGIASTIAQALAKEKGIDLEDASEFDHEAFKQTQYDILADMIRNNMDMEKVYAMLAESKV